MNSNDLQLAALLCSRLCHDLISPVGAIANGLEVLRDEEDEEMKAHALSLIEASAHQASARLQFARIAFGAAGSAGAEIETGDAAELARNLLLRGKVSLDWRLANVMAPKNAVKLLLNLILIALDCIPRGGTLRISGDMGGGTLELAAEGPRAKLGADVRGALETQVDFESCDSRLVQPAFTRLIAGLLRASLSIEEGEDRVIFRVPLNAAP